MGQRLFETLLEFQLQFFDAFLSEVGDFIQVAMFGDDLGTQKAPMISPQLYREVVKPFHARLFTFVKTRYTSDEDRSMPAARHTNKEKVSVLKNCLE